ncbi:MAG: hypothetical protein KDB90_03525 [Planctomycetes bacterium]|nr:hypothetical protein [Planctomycetota bacterium]
MPVAESPREVRDLLAGRPGGVNRVLRRFAKPVIDYATALIPDRSAPFERMVEDILVDVISQARTTARAQSDEQVFEYVIESALHTVRARYRDVLDGEAKPSKATTSYNFKEVLERTKLTEAELTAGISEGKYRAVRDNDQLKIKGDSIPGLGARKASQAYHVTAAERELLCLHFRLGFSPELIARWAGLTATQIEELLGKAANRLAEGMARKNRGSADPKDTTMRRYIDGRMPEDETAKFERSIIKDKIAQRRLDELRSQSDAIRELFDSAPYELSSIAVNVRARNPHHALALPPVAALWLQVVGIAAIMLMFHSVGAYIAPPEVEITAVEGTPRMPTDARLKIGDSVETPDGSQARLVLDDANRVLMAPGSKLKLLEPRENARQVMGLEAGEIWGRFTSAGHAFVVEFPVSAGQVSEIASSGGADFDLIVGPATSDMLPDNLERERLRAFVAAFEPGNGGIAAKTAMLAYAGFRFAEPGLEEGDRIESVEGIAIGNREDLLAAVSKLKAGEQLKLTIGRGQERVALSVARIELKPQAIVRVFHGSINAGREGAERVLINRGQWAMFFDGQPPLVGVRGMEDFRVLRISADERFKTRLHWLNTESFPLRAENNLLVVDRALRALAAKLEAMRAEEILRDGPREITAFENIMLAAIEDADARLKAEEGHPKGDGAASLSDKALVASKDDVLGIIGHWRRQAATGVYPTLGNAAKTLSAPISRFRDELESRGEELTRSILLQEDIKKLQKAIDEHDAEIALLKSSDFYDADGSERAAYDAQIAELEKEVRAGDDAKGRVELLKIKLNALDQKIDAEKRKLPGLRKSVDDAQAALDEVDQQLAANVYTAAKLAAAEQKLEDAKNGLAAAQTALETIKSEVKLAEDAVAAADKALTDARAPLADLQATKDAADDLLVDAVAARGTAQAASETADAEVERIQAELDALAADDPGRAAKQTELDNAKATAKTAADNLNNAINSATDAKTAVDNAAAKLDAAEATVEQKALALEDERKKSTDAANRRNEAATAVTTASNAVTTAETALKIQQDAKTARALLDTRRADAATTLGVAKADLATVEDKAASLDAEAEPKREELGNELAIISKADTATQTIADKKDERGRYQAISDDIARHEKDRAAVVAQRDQIAGSNLVVNHETLTEEYETLSRRIDAYEFVRARGLLEDETFAHEQKAAQDRFREAAVAAGLQAVDLLKGYCPDYAGDAYKPFTGDEGARLRKAVLEALWKLYYDAGLEAESDGNTDVCYYVAVQSGAGADALTRIDDRWKAYLSEALGKQGFEAIAELSPSSLQPAPALKE